MSRVRNNKRGVVVIMVALTSLAMVGFMGLAVDVANLEWNKVRAQTAADAAVRGALYEKKNNSTTTIVTAGRADAALNGFTNGTDGVTVTINNPPTSGSLAGNANAVEAIVTKSVSTFFMSTVGPSTGQVTARAVGLLTAASGGAGGCIYALNRTESQGFSIAGSNATYFSCSAFVNSSHNSAFKMEGSGTLYMKNESTVNVVGGSQLTGQTAVRDFEDNSLEPPRTVEQFEDPLAHVVAPSGASLTLRSSSTANYDMNNRPSGNTIQPGVYCGGLRIGNTGGQTFTMAPGVYVMGGGGFWFGSQAKISGTGVTIYNTSGANSGKPGCTAAFSAFDITGQAEVNLSAPTSGDLKGILIMQDRSITGNHDNKIVGGSTSVFNGAIYLKNSPIKFSGNNSSSLYSILVADIVTINGNSTINADYSTLTGGSPIGGNSAGSTISLAE